MIKSASDETGLPMGVLSAEIPAIRLRGISVQPAIHIMEIKGCKPLQHVPATSIPATPRSATHVLAYHSHAFAVDALPPGYDFAGRVFPLRCIEIPTEEAWGCRRVGKPVIRAFQGLDLDPAVGHAGRNMGGMDFHRSPWHLDVDRQGALGPGTWRRPSSHGRMGKRLAISSPYRRGPVGRAGQGASSKLSAWWISPQSASNVRNSESSGHLTSYSATTSGI